MLVSTTKLSPKLHLYVLTVCKKKFVLVSCYDNVFLWSVSGYTEY